MKINPTMVVGESRLFREGLASLLSNTPYKVASVGDICDVPKILEEAGKPPELVLFGLATNHGDGLDELIRVRESYPDSRIVVLASTPSKRNFSQCLSVGVDGYLLTDISPEVLIDSLRLIFLGEKVFPTILAAWIVDDDEDMFSGPTELGDKGLSRRELEILYLVVEGKSNKTIANSLRIGDVTVKIHLRRILKKIDATNRTQAAVWAVNHGMALTDRSNRSQGTPTPSEENDHAISPPSRTAG